MNADKCMGLIRPGTFFLILMFGSVLTSLAEPSGLCVTAPASLIGWWRAEDASNPNEVELVNGATTTSGRVGQAFSLDGLDDYVDAGDSALLDVTTEMTVEGWIRPASLDQDAVIISRYDRSAGGCGWRLRLLAGGRVGFEVAGEKSGFFRQAVETTQALVPVQAFTHLAATFQGPTQRLKIFVNGSEVPVTIVPLSQSVLQIAAVTSPVWIGASRDSQGLPSGFFKGLIDEVSIYRRFLNAGEIAGIYQAGESGKCYPPPLEIFLHPTRVPPRGQVSVRVYGGRPPYQVSLAGNNSGATVLPAAPAAFGYRAGWTSNVVDLLTITDTLGAEVQGTVTVMPLTMYEWREVDGGNGRRYALSLNADDWYSVQSEAWGLGGNLVAINTAAEQDFIQSTFLVGPLEHRPLWIGLTKDGYADFRWVTQEPLSAFQFWSPGEPGFALDTPFGVMNWTDSVTPSPDAHGRWSATQLGGTVGSGGGSDGPYHGILEFPPALRLSPVETNRPIGGAVTFIPSGGNPPYQFTFVTNRSGGKMTSSAFGTYQAGLAAEVDDVVQVTDSLGQAATAVVHVTSLALHQWRTEDGGNGHFYGVTPDPLPWTLAADQAIFLGGMMASITSPGEQSFITREVLTGPFQQLPLWIGLTDREQEGEFKWLTEEPLGFTSWAPNEPAAAGANDDYVVMNWRFASGGGPPEIPGTWSVVGVLGTYTDEGGRANGPYHGLIEVLPRLTISPTNATVSRGETLQFTVTGAEGALTFSIVTFQKIGTIQSGTGLYTAGNGCNGSETIRVMDAAGRAAFATVTYVDRATPYITCPGNPTAVAGPEGTAPVPYLFPHAIGDECGSVDFVQVPAPGTPVPPGLHLITLTATDAAGNTNSCVNGFTVLAPTYVVSGRVTNKVSGAPMPGQKVRLVQYLETNRVFLQTFTDALGAYRFAGNPACRLLSVFPENKGFTYVPALVRRENFSADLLADFGAVEPLAAIEKVAIAGIEVVQSVQDWKNSVPLIAAKETYVRVNVRNNPASSATGSQPFTGRLQAFRAGVELSDSPLSPLSPGFTSTAGDALSRRGDLAGTLNFRLPPAWHAAGTLELRLQPDTATPAVCLDPAEANGGGGLDCLVRVTFQPLGIIRLKIFRAIERNQLRPDEIDAAVARMKGMFPAHALDVQVADAYFARGDLGQALHEVERLQMMDGCGYGRCGRLYFGAFAEPLLGGVALFEASAGCGNLVTLPHEIAHNLGLDHTARGDSNCRECGFCGERAAYYFDPFPFPAEVNGHTVAALGPMDPAAPENWIFGLFSEPGAGSPSVISPYADFELMSYCNSGTGWTSSHTYNHLINRISSRFPNGNNFQPASALGEPRQFYLVGGSISTADGTVSLDPIVPALVPDPGPPLPGDYTIVLLDQNGAVLSETSFQPSETLLDSPGPRPRSFNLLVPYTPAAVAAVVRSNALAIAIAERSSHAPLLSVATPAGGEVFAGDTIQVAWSAIDLDGDPLTYTVQYSPNGGITFVTLATGTPTNRLELSRSSLAAGTNAIFRIFASDGFNHDSADTGPFSVLNNPPRLSVASPAPGALFAGEATIVFSARGDDTEDGSPLETIVWRSSVDGELGIGSTLFRSALSLSAGTHDITATLTDSGQSTTSVAFGLKIVRFHPLLLEGLGFDVAGRFGLRVMGEAGARHVLEAATSLGAWAPIETNSLSSTVYEFWDPSATNGMRRFYRTVLAP